jgi:hypothetical protein
MVKTHSMISIDSELKEELKKRGINLTKFTEEQARQFIAKTTLTPEKQIEVKQQEDKRLNDYFTTLAMNMFDSDGHPQNFTQFIPKQQTILKRKFNKDFTTQELTEILNKEIEALKAKNFKWKHTVVIGSELK